MAIGDPQDPGTLASPADPNAQRLSKLQNLANVQLPQADKQIQQTQQAGRQLGLQQAIGAAPATGSNIQGTAQALGAQMGQQAGQQALKLGGEQQANLTSIGQMGLEAQGSHLKSEAAKREAGQQLQFQDFANQLDKISTNLKSELIDKQLTFQRDAQGRAILTDSQLNDLALSKAKSQIDLNQYKQTTQQTWEAKVQLMQAMSDKINQALSQQAQLGQQALNQQQLEVLQSAKTNADLALAKAKADAANNAQAWTSASQVLGAVAGGTAGFLASGGNPLVAAVGAQAGSYLVGAAGSSLNAALNSNQPINP